MLSGFLTLAQVEPRGGLYAMVGWVLLAAIVLAFLLFGLGDLRRLSWARISAISSVSFDESIRRRVLWVTPLAIIGAVVVSQLLNPVDPQDTIRQTTKICLFASGLVVVLVALILASTNLQKEIDTRVIYTIVTKPTTRLEIVLGKVWGFAKVSAAILLIMGVFTYAYLSVREWRLRSSIASTLQALPEDAVNRDTLQHYRDAGLLSAKAMTPPELLEMLARPPVEGQPRVLAGGHGQKFSVPFKLTEDQYQSVISAMQSAAAAKQTAPVIAFVLDVPIVTRDPTPAEVELIEQLGIPMRDASGALITPPSATQPTTQPATSPSTAPSTSPATQPTGRPVPRLAMMTVRPRGQTVLERDKFGKDGAVELPPSGRVVVPISMESADKLFEAGTFIFTVETPTPSVEYSVTDHPVTLQVLSPQGGAALHTFEPVYEEGKLNRPMITGGMGRYGQQLVGGPVGEGGVAVFHFKDVRPASADADQLTFEVKVGVERSGDYTGEVEILPEAHLHILNPKTGALSEAQKFRVESNRISYVSFPKSAFPQDGDFAAVMRVLTPGQWLGVERESVSLATGSRSFAWNLAKSLLIIWLLSVLVVSIAVFCSTFLSWPVAVVLTLVILFGRWGVDQIGETGGPGLGAQMTGQTDDPTRAKVARTVVDTLTRSLVVVSAFLPNVSAFEATTDIERGISVPFSRFAAAGWVLLGYGLPMVILAYLVLKRKEVAP